MVKKRGLQSVVTSADSLGKSKHLTKQTTWSILRVDHVVCF